jgi:hypothetical protein
MPLLSLRFKALSGDQNILSQFFYLRVTTRSPRTGRKYFLKTTEELTKRICLEYGQVKKSAKFYFINIVLRILNLWF